MITQGYIYKVWMELKVYKKVGVKKFLMYKEEEEIPIVIQDGAVTTQFNVRELFSGLTVLFMEGMGSSIECAYSTSWMELAFPLLIDEFSDADNIRVQAAGIAYISALSEHLYLD